MNWRCVSRRYEAGVWAIPLALIPSFLFSALFGQPSCTEPLIEFIIVHTPLAVANVLLNALGPAARPLALVGSIALLLPIGGLLGILAPSIDAPKPDPVHRVRWFAVAAFAIGAGIFLGSAAIATISTLSAVLAGMLFLPMLLWTRTWRRAKSKPTLSSRRKVLRCLSGTPLFLASIAALSSYEAMSKLAIQAFSPGSQVRQLFHSAAPKARQPGFPVDNMEPEVTPVAQFYYNGKNATDPLILPDDWQLQINGHVRNPLTLTYAQLMQMPRTNFYATLRCVDNPIDGHLMSTALWSGVRIAELLALAQPLPGATMVVFHAADQFDEPFSLSQLSPDNALLAYAMNGETLSQAHGAPVRALLPGWYGFRNIKWLQGLELTDRPTGGYWEQNGWTAGKVHPMARIDVAQILDQTHILAAGVAYGGLKGVSAVQVRVDAGPWLAAELNVPPLSPYTWVQWRIIVSVSAADFHLTAHMIDADGMPQDEQAQPVYPNGSSGLHTIEVKR